jgi:cyclic-di-AMP phosphodiesterase PgpH
MTQQTASPTLGNQGAAPASGPSEVASSAQPSETRFSRILRTLLLGLALWVAWGLTSLLPSADSLRVTIGEASRRDIKAPHQVTYVSEVETEAAREDAAARVADVYVSDTSVATTQIERLSEVLATIEELRGAPALPADERPALAQVALSDADWANLLALSDASWELVARESERVLGLIMRDEIRASDLPRARRDVQRLILGTLSAAERDAVNALVSDLIVVNMVVDQARTEARRAEMRNAVAPVIRTIRAGESIVREGEIVTETIYERLEILDLLDQGPDWQQIAAEMGFALLVVAILIFYVARVDPLLMGRPRRQLLLVAALMVAGITARVLLPGHTLLPYLFPGAAAAMIVVLFMNIQYATLIAVAVALIVGISADSSLPLAIYMLLGSLVGALALMRTEQLSAFAPATGYLALVNIATLLLFRISSGDYDLLGLLQLTGAGLANAVLSSSLCLVAYAFTGRIFGITTSLQLMDLARPTHPLFRQLLIKAPGTYHHSILISNMAERAAEAIGADILLTRVGSYYHDIGKTLRPHFFSENQADGQNPHDKLDPQTSAEIVISHTSDGLELARRYRLPDKVCAFITEHHGTTLVTYFYRQASQAAEDHEVDEQAFRYPGPKPQSRETAILMLADGVEAWVRADRPATEPEMERVIRQVINDRLISGQLDETDLTLKDLDSIRQAFGSVLKGLYHPRIQYPERTVQRKARTDSG